jgi:DNA-nicking Smr family endonuclease
LVRKRDLRDDERELWEHVTRDVRKRSRKAKPVRPVHEPKLKAKPAPQPSAATAPARIVLPPTPVKKAPPPFGVDGATAKRLQRGKIEPDATIDLHGMTQAQAHARLASFVRHGHDIGNRCVLVITGKGGVLRELAPRWLEELRSAVTGVHAAHQRHGGGGAFYVYLRRKR